MKKNQDNQEIQLENEFQQLLIEEGNSPEKINKKEIHFSIYKWRKRKRRRI